MQKKYLIGSTPYESTNEYNIDFKLMKDLGFEAIDIQNFISINSLLYSMSQSDFINYLNGLKAELAKYNFKVWQLHSLWDFKNIDLDKPENWATTLPYYIRAIEGAKILNCKYVVIHHRFPFGYLENENTIKFGQEINIQFLKLLIPYAKVNDVILCLENLPFETDYSKIDGTLNIINKINSPYVGMCLDTGHYNVTDSNVSINETIKKIGNKLKVLHVHDNFGDKDSHLLPGLGNIIWEGFFSSLKEINFNGCISLESRSINQNKKQLISEEKSTIKYLKSLY